MKNRPLKISPWITVKSNGSVRVSKGRPNLSLEEISFQLNLEIPVEYFTKPLISASLSIPFEGDNQAEVAIDVQKISEAITTETGLKVELTINESQ